MFQLHLRGALLLGEIVLYASTIFPDQKSILGLNRRQLPKFIGGFRLREAGITGIARDVADFMVGSPYAAVRQLSDANAKTYKANSSAVNNLIELGLLEEIPNGSRRVIRAPDVVRANRT